MIQTPDRRSAPCRRFLPSLLALWLLAAVAPAALAVSAPQAVADSWPLDLTPGTRLLDVTANDFHPDGLAFRVVDVTAPLDENGDVAGSLTLYDDGSLSFTLTAAGPRRIELSYALEDSTGTRSAPASVCLGECLQVIVAASTDRLTAEIGVATVLDVLANDVGDDLQMVGWTQPEAEHGATLVWDPVSRTFTYTATVLGDGEDHFSYTVEDATNEPDTAVVTVTLLPAGGTSSAEAVLVLDHCVGTLGPPLCYFVASGSTGSVGPADLEWGDGSPVQAVSNLTWIPHTFPPGNADYLVTLTVYDGQGLPDSASLWVHAPDAPPTLGGPVYYDCLADLSCTFNASTSNDVTTWLWDFGHGTTSTIPGPLSHVFPAPGSYTVTLTVTDAAGQSTTRSITVSIEEVPPVVLDVTVACSANLHCVLTAATEDPLAVLWYHWDFGDGDPIFMTNDNDPGHAYDSHGRYAVTLTAEGRGESEDVFSTEIWVGDDHRMEVGSSAATPGFPQQVDLRNDFASPVVIIQPLAYGGSSPVVARLTEVASDHFTVELQAAGTLPGGGLPFDYLVVDEGVWQLSDGSVVEAWRLPRGVPYEWPDDLDLAEVGRLKGELWFRAPFLHFFAEPPVVLTQVQTDQEASFVNTRQRRTTEHWVDLALEEPEADATAHAFEVLGMVAVTPGRRTVEGFRDAGAYDAGYRLDAKTTQGIPDGWTTVTLGGPFTVPPLVFAGVITYEDADSVTLRRSNLTATSVDLRVHEDRTLDSEVVHPKETAGLLAVSEAGLLLTQALAPSSQAAPVAGSDFADTGVGQPVTVLVLANDADADGEPVSIEYAGNPQNGYVELLLYPLNRGLALTWYPPPSFAGTDSLTYRVRDSAGLLSAPQVVDLKAVQRTPGVLFNRAFDNSTLLRGWVPLEGAAEVLNGAVELTAPGANHLLWQGGGGWSDYRLETELQCAGGAGVGVTLHYLDDENQLQLRWDAGRGEWVVEQLVEGEVTELAAVAAVLDPATTYQFQAEVDSGTLSWSYAIAGVTNPTAPTVHQVSFKSLGQGSIALYGDGCGRFDDVKVTDLGVTP